MQSLFEILMLLLNVLWFFIIAHVIMSWLINFQVLNTRQQLVAQIWYGLNRILEPIYAPIRRVLPQMGGIDLAPWRCSWAWRHFGSSSSTTWPFFSRNS